MLYKSIHIVKSNYCYWCNANSHHFLSIGKDSSYSTRGNSWLVKHLQFFYPFEAKSADFSGSLLWDLCSMVSYQLTDSEQCTEVLQSRSSSLPLPKPQVIIRGAVRKWEVCVPFQNSPRVRPRGIWQVLIFFGAVCESSQCETTKCLKGSRAAMWENV